MFECRKTALGEQKKINWENREVFLLSFCKEERTEAAFYIEENEDTVAVSIKGEIKAREPYFGPQDYFEPKEGIKYRVDIPDSSKYIAVYQHKEWWIRPDFFENISDMPNRSQLLIMKTEDTYFVLLAVCGAEYRSDMRGMLGGIEVSISSNVGNHNRVEDISIVIAGGSNPFLCCENAVRKALAILGKPAMLRRNRKYPSMFESFGWCSWDAFYHKVSHAGIREKMEEFKEKKLPVKWVLIDDGWLDADYEKQVLRDLDARKSNFPEGLYSCVKELKEVYGIEQVGVWHAIMGYWNGLEKDSAAAKQLMEGSRVLPDGRILPEAEAGKAFVFYDKWHEYLKNKCEIDFVKVDGQSAVSLAYGGMESYGRASREIQKGLNASAALHFNNNIINCMGMGSEDMWNRPSSAISRSSDDFVPEVPHGFREHAIQNSYNSLLQGQFFWGDWDMFFSNHIESMQNSILRAVSGGPVYVSDKVGETEPKYILPLITKEGKVLRCQDTGVPTLDCLFENPVDTVYPLKIFNQCDDNYVVAALNINKDEQTCSGIVGREDIPGLAGRNWLVFAWTQQKVYSLGAEGVLFSLEPNGGELFLIMPKAEAFQIIGVLDKYIPFKTAECIQLTEVFAEINIKEQGTFGFISSCAPIKILLNGEEITALSKGNDFYTFACKADCSKAVIYW